MSQGTRPAFQRLAIVNRGEPAMRLINAVREWNAEGRPPLRTIAVNTAVDRRAMFVREADEAVLIGPADPEKEGTAFGHDPYLDYAELERALRACRAEAVWPGWGFVSEQAEFAELCDRLGITFIGPTADVMRRLGDKIESKRLAEQVGVPLAAWSGGPVAARHVEVQVVADADGTVWTMGIRDCSVQRRNHKVIEESASTALDAGQEELLRSSAAELIRAAGYVNAGTVAFRYQPKERLLSFLEVNPRLQVEHPVTEVTTGVDIVKLQLHVAAGGKLADVAPHTPPESGHAIEARLAAEDPERGFAPAPGLIQHGLIQHLVLPTGPGIRVDTGVAAGDVIPPQYDSMIAKVIGWGRDRCEARARLSRARRLDVALLAAAVEAHDAHVQRQQGRLFTAAERGRPEVEHESWYQIDVRAAGEAYRLRVARSRPARYRVELGGHAVDVDVERAGRFERRLTVGNQTFAVLSVAQGSGYLVEVDGAVHRISGGEAGLVRAPVAGQVAEVLVDANTQVEGGTKLVRMEPDPELDGVGDLASGLRAELSALAALRSLVLGYSIDEREARSLLDGLAAARADLPAEDPGLLAGEIEVLRIFADLCALSRNRRVPDGMEADDESAVDAEATRNPQEYLYAYLRSRDADAEGLPESFRIKLRRALAHYRVTDLEPSPDLGPALYRIFLAHRRAGAHVPVVSELLQCRLRHPESLPDDARDGYRQVLDHLVSATQLRHPVIGDLARQVRYRCFDAPLIAGEQARVQQQVRAELDRLSPHRFDAPIEWFAVSAGAKIAMDSGSETMDWISRVLRGIIEFTQDGGEINVVVTGINVGAQPYWNTEATMLMHTKGILVMTPDSAMVLTGKQSLDYSGGVSAEDNFGIGGYDRIMGPNGQAQYWAPDLSKAVDVLLAHYEHTYTAPGERFPRVAPTTDPTDRDVSASPHSGPGCDFTALGEIFDPATNGERKKPFDVRSLLRGVADADHPPLERWADMHDAESVVVLDAHVGGQPVSLIGIESRALPRHGPSPVDGPSLWTAGTLFPRSSKKTARAINAASGNRPLVVLANLSGFDGSPESLRGLQLEYGAEIGRAVVNFDGPIVFCVVSRYHGGAFVVFSGTLNDNMEIAAVEGSYPSVIGGAPAAAVVFAGEINKRTAADPRVADLETRIAETVENGADADTARLRAELAAVRPAVRSEKLGQVADEFDNRHSIERARSMGSVHTIIPATRLRPYLADAVQRGIARTLTHEDSTTG